MTSTGPRPCAGSTDSARDREPAQSSRPRGERVPRRRPPAATSWRSARRRRTRSSVAGSESGPASRTAACDIVGSWPDDEHRPHVGGDCPHQLDQRRSTPRSTGRRGTGRRGRHRATSGRAPTSAGSARCSSRARGRARGRRPRRRRPTLADCLRPTSESGRWMSGIDSGCSALAWRRSRSRRGPVSDVTGSASHYPKRSRPGDGLTDPSRGRRRRRARSRRWSPGTSRTAARATARAVGSGSIASQPSGARSGQPPSMASKPGIDLAAVVRIGPAETRFTRMPCGPRSRAR